MDNNNNFDSLEKKLQQAELKRLKEEEKNQEKIEDDTSMRRGMRAGYEFVGSILGGGAIGYLIDMGLGTKPAFTLILFFLGVFAGFYNVYRITQGMGTAVGNSGLHENKKESKTTDKLKN